MKTSTGAELRINAAPFEESLELLHAFLEEAKAVEIKAGKEHLPNVLKNVFCGAFSSPKLRVPLWKCMERCLYKGVKITPAAFEDVKAREDYMEICYLVAEENLKPFTKSLYAQFEELLKKIESLPA
jgi:hypothetical protein